jgi:hypothetical protein
MRFTEYLNVYEVDYSGEGNLANHFGLARMHGSLGDMCIRTQTIPTNFGG